MYIYSVIIRDFCGPYTRLPFDLHVSGRNKLISNFIPEMIYTSTLNDLLWHLDDFVLFVQQKLKPEKDLVRNVVMVVVGAKTHTDILQEI